MPLLTVIAGPNGAGKSTLSSTFLEAEGIKAFDYDHEFYSYWEEFDFDPILESNLRSTVADRFVERIETAIELGKNFSFENNYHTSDIINIVDRFKNAGFATRLIFIFLHSEAVAISRVLRRVSEGGHGVSEATIRERFEKGLMLLDDTFHIYDEVFLYESIELKLKPLIYIQPESSSLAVDNNIPALLAQRLKKISAFTAKGKKIKKKKWFTL